jgi:hypothetical protein
LWVISRALFFLFLLFFLLSPFRSLLLIRIARIGRSAIGLFVVIVLFRFGLVSCKRSFIKFGIGALEIKVRFRNFNFYSLGVAVKGTSSPSTSVIGYFPLTPLLVVAVTAF